MGEETGITDRDVNGHAGNASAARLDDRVAGALAERLESVLARLESLPDQPVRAVALEAVESLVQLYGEGLARIVDQVAGSGNASLAEAMASDPLVSHLLLLHGLHPDDTAVRVQRALDEVEPYLHGHGCEAELVAIDGELARVRCTGNSHGYASARRTLHAAVEDALLRAAPEITRVEIEDAVHAAPALVPIASPRRKGTRGRAPSDSAASTSHVAQPPAP
jgi:Fe-S cluster biogenesis protein NfuA